MRCPACHKEYDDDMEYCPFCGNDNPNVDQREIREAQQEEREEKNENSYQSLISPIQVDDNHKTMVFQTDDGNYTAHFDMTDQKEASSYEELQHLESGKSITGFISFFLCFFSAITLVIALRRNTSAENITISIVFAVLFFIGFFVAYSKYGKYAVKSSQRQMDYFRYKIVKDGGEILANHHDTRVITYKLNGQTKSVKFRYHIWGRRYRYWD